VRSYVAFAGGIGVAPVLGSRSTDTLSGLGPVPLRAGSRLTLLEAASTPADDDPAEPAADTWESLVLRVRLGPRHDWFTLPARDALLSCAYRLSAKSNRVGARLSGDALIRANAMELPSEGITVGAVQVPADGQPLVFLADHPTTGGYPVIAVVDRTDLPLLAQARPGATVRFAPWT
ncbi:MAG: biotin-dependent carboxyltransferase family protein, partial [Micromonosporaceae bacterium]